MTNRRFDFFSLSFILPELDLNMFCFVFKHVQLKGPVKEAGHVGQRAGMKRAGLPLAV